MPSTQSISLWITHLKEGNEEAAQRLWERYATQLVELARRRLQGAPKRVADEEDIAASVFHSLCRGAAAGRLQNVKNRDDLWWLLLTVTRQKVVDYVRRETALKRGGGRVRIESGVDADSNGSRAFNKLISSEPTPEFMVMLQEQHDRLLSLLRDDHLRSVAVSRIEGFTVSEIARRLGVSTRSIERKLALIRGVWSTELEIESSAAD
jgi:RNA polymerase sigma factor (sigma-70 family)